MSNSYDPKDGHKTAKKVDATDGYQDPQSRQKYILMIDQAIWINLYRTIYCAPCSVV